MARDTITVKILGDSSGLVGAVGDAGASLGKFGLVAGAAFATAGVAAVAGLASIGESFDAAYDAIRLGTGATGEALDGLKDSFKSVSTSVAGVSFDQVSTAIADLNTRTGLVGKPLEELSSQFLQLSKITETDVAGNVANLTRVFGDWGITAEDQAGTLDKFWRASQSTGAGIDQLSDQVVQFGAPLRQLGFSFEDSLAMLGKWEKEGVNTELVLGGMKKALGTFAKEGKDAPAALRDLTAEIKGIQDPTEATQRAIEVFGIKAGPDMAAAIREGRFDFEQYLAAIEGGSETIGAAAADTDDWREKLQLLKNKAMVALEPLANRVFAALGTAVDFASGAVASFIGTFQNAADGVTSSGFNGFIERFAILVREVYDWFVANWPAFQEILLSVWRAYVQYFTEYVVPVFSAIVETAKSVIAWFQDNWPAIQEVLMDVFAWVQANVLPLVAAIGEFITELIGTVVQYVQDHWVGISQIFDAVATTIGWIVSNVLEPAIKAGVAIFQNAAPVIGAVLEGLTTAFAAVIDGIKWSIDNVFTPAWALISTAVQTGYDLVAPVLEAMGELFGTMADVASGAFKGVTDTLKKAWNSIANLWNSGPGAISFNVGIPGVGDVGFDVPNLPVLHSGGWVPGNGDVPIMAQSGEFVLSRDNVEDILRGGGARTYNVYVSDGRSVLQELQLVDALYGAAA